MNSNLLSGWLLGIFFGQLLGIIIIPSAHKTDGGWVYVPNRYQWTGCFDYHEICFEYYLMV